MWIHERAPSDPLLRRHIRKVWLLELEAPESFGMPERIVPDGIVEAVFHYGQPFAMRYDGEPFAEQPAGCSISQTHRHLEIRLLGPSGFVAVRFEPWGAHHFFPASVAELADRCVPAQALWGRDADLLLERLAAGSSAGERIALVEGFQRGQLGDHGIPEIEPWVRRLQIRRGLDSIRGLCRDLGVGERRLERAFRTALGTTPKHYAMLVRFLYACKLLDRRPDATLTALAQELEYADQAHFSRDFKAFAGVSPGEFRAHGEIAHLDLE